MPNSVTLIDHSEAWLKQEEARLQTGLGRMAQAILGTARAKVPKKYNNLVNTGRVKGTGNERTVTFGGGSVRYALPQERGYQKRNGKIVQFKHYTTPDTGAHYLEQSGDKIVKEGIKKYLPK